MKLKHKEKQQTITVEAKRGQIVADRKGLVRIIDGNFKGMDKIALNVLEEQFEKEIA